MAAAKKQIKGIEEERAETIVEIEEEQEEDSEILKQEKQATFIKLLMDCSYSKELALKAYQHASAEDIENEDVTDGKMFVYIWIIRDTV